jgi:hypothetical protein
MRSRAIIPILSLVLAAGCTQLKDVFTPTKPPPPSPPRPAQPERREPPPRLSPQVSSDQEERLMDEATSKIQGAERTLLSIDERKLTSDQQETFHTIQSFLTQAKAALSRKDFPKAINLAQKAQVLSDELSRAPR